MSKKLSNTQQVQLAFPGLEPFATPTGAANVEKSADSAAARSSARKRTTSAKIALVTEARKAQESDAEQPLPEATQAVEPSPLLRVDSPPLADFSVENPAEKPATSSELCVPPTAEGVSVTPGAVTPSASLATSSSNETHVQLAAYLATILASLSVIVAVSVGSYQFSETQKNQRALFVAQETALGEARIAKTAELNSRAIELFLKYNELMLQANAPASKNVRPETRFWKEHLAVNLLESLFNLTRGSKEWENAIRWAVDRHARFIQKQQLSCASYSPEFVAYLEESFGTNSGLLCKDSPR